MAGSLRNCFRPAIVGLFTCLTTGNPPPAEKKSSAAPATGSPRNEWQPDTGGPGHHLLRRTAVAVRSRSFLSGRRVPDSPLWTS